MGWFLSLPVHESSSVDECPAEALELIALASGDWTPVSTVEVILEPCPIPSSLFLLHSLQKLRRDNILDFPLVIRISDALHVWLFLSGPLPIHTYFIWINSYSLFILQYLLRIHFRKLMTSEKIWGSFLCLSPLNFTGVFLQLCITVASEWPLPWN